MGMLLNLAIVMGCTALAVAWERRQCRSAVDVWNSLGDSGDSAGGRIEQRRGDGRVSTTRGYRRYLPVLIAAAVSGAGGLAGSSVSSIFILFGIGLCFGFIVQRRLHERDKSAALRELDFYVPLMMERIVMAAHAGLDVLSAVRAVVQHEQRQTEMTNEGSNPVCALLAEVLSRSDRGMSFERALQDIAVDTGSHSIRHAFLHLAMAHKEGGELIAPLRELSDATLLHYQETIEEEIAKLPAKATMPLILTFTGLIVLFLTPPLLSVMDIATRAQIPAASGAAGRK